VRILVDESGYDLLNIGDVAMLQACVIRLRQLWADAEIMVIAHAPDRLAASCPATAAIGPALVGQPLLRLLPRRGQLVSEQAWKIAAPYLSHRFRGRGGPRWARTAIQAVQAADLVVASGGGYLTDTWWWHGAGVLSLLSLAQRLGKPTAMFGQGVGPISGRFLRVQARSVLPKLTILGLREDRTGHDLALSLGARPGAVTLTGDDALEVIPVGSAPDGYALGVNIRASGYAGVRPAGLAALGEVLAQTARALRVPIVGLPVARYAADADFGAIGTLLRSAQSSSGGVVLRDLTTPAALASAAAQCRAIVTGSYHAAVFGLAHGVPAVCLTKSRYYDAKFDGLRALFPSACSVVSLDQPDAAAELRRAIDEAWHLPSSARAAARESAQWQRTAGRAAYARFRDAVEQVPAAANAGQELIA
jgi:colanic acid/amylovoran biosynthesis protein